MRFPRRMALAIALGLLLPALAGCYEEPGDVVLHEPGVYKGPDDPLLGNVDEEELRQRFSGQTDR